MVELESLIGYREAEAAPPRQATLLPDPERRERRHTIISVDDHLVEPPWMFEGRLPARFVERGPRVVDTPDGGQAWLYDGHLLPNVGFNAVVGRPEEEHSWEPTRFEHMRPGTYDVHERVRDMDLNGVYASLNFPSFLAGFGGGRIQTIVEDRDLALATVRAYNDWHLEEWCGSHPDRLIPNQLPWLHDPVLAAAEVERNAARGFKAVTFPETPHELGLPTIFDPGWEPFMRACAETGTVLCLHTGSGGTLPSTTADAPLKEVLSVLFGVYAAITATDWLFSDWPAKYPDLQICLSEGGIGWLPSVIDRIESRLRKGGRYQHWIDLAGIHPLDILHRNFWFCFLEDRVALEVLDEIGEERVMFEVDYPHTDTSWPDTQAILDAQIRHLPVEQQARLTWRNASELFRHPVPVAVQRDPDAY